MIKGKFELNGKVAIVTGASKGIGESIARGLAEFGAKVVVSSRNQEAVDDVAHSIIEEGYIASAKACHVGSEDQLAALVKFTKDQFGTVDILVNNAATNPVFGPIEDMSGDLFDKMMHINVKSAFILSNLVFPFMKSQKNGSLIHISSVEGFKPSPGLSIYSVSKASLIMLAKAQSKEWGKYNIRTNVICPGLVKTKFSSALWQNESILNHWTNQLPLQRMAMPDEISGLAVYLASDASAYCTGQTFTVDGGYLIA